MRVYRVCLWFLKCFIKRVPTNSLNTLYIHVLSVTIDVIRIWILHGVEIDPRFFFLYYICTFVSPADILGSASDKRLSRPITQGYAGIILCSISR